ncbi:degradation in the endoplasmic reticulum protein 1 [Trichomonascus vanleenenianus]|uniref:derlin n=1 Tax=Trichomonascus vanleenenianus TaxID=2268995 RepID=UPI003ECA129B
MERFVEERLLDIPKVTRYWTIGIIGMAVLDKCELISELQVMYSFRKVFEEHEYWRLLTTFIYFGPLSISFLFQVLFITKFSRMLEESHYGHSSRDYMWILSICAFLNLGVAVVSHLLGFGTGPFLSLYLSDSLTYLWCRRNPHVEMSILGLLRFEASYFPWYSAAVTGLLNGPSGLKISIVGNFVGHFVYFCEDIVPEVYNMRPLAPPWTWFQREHEHQD